jgi:hypothetical protein
MLPVLVKAQDYDYSTNNGAITITQYKGPGGIVTIPETMDGLPVINLGNSAFSSCASLTSVTVPTRVTSIGSWAFSSCSSLTSISIPGVTNIGAYAFYRCTGLSNLVIPSHVASIGGGAFHSCSSLTSVYFQGDAPSLGAFVFLGANKATVYYLPDTLGWGGPTFGGRPAVLWNPVAQASGGGFGVRTNQFGFRIAGTSNLVIVVEACTNLSFPLWYPVQTNTLTDGTSYFSDPQWRNIPARFYRLRSR